jgi:Domain of unknown function (DUF4430)
MPPNSTRSARTLARPLRRVALATLLGAGLVAGCGLGAGPTPGAVTLTVTREFGARALRSPPSLRVHGQETVMSLLMRNYAVTTRYGGGFVESINGHAGGYMDGDPNDWFYYVNGVEAPEGAAETDVHQGDAIWWDLHDWGQATHTPAVVGSFPEPFVRGVEGKRLPVRIECAEPESNSCHTVTGRLRALGVPAGLAGLGPAGEFPDTLRVAVGPWTAMRALPAAQTLTRGPRASGVYARVGANGGSITLLDARGQSTQTLGAGSGLVAAVSYPGEEPLWVITGTNAAGVARAADAFDRSALRDRFAVALPPAGTILALPRPG